MLNCKPNWYDVILTYILPHIFSKFNKNIFYFKIRIERKIELFNIKTTAFLKESILTIYSYNILIQDGLHYSGRLVAFF